MVVAVLSAAFASPTLGSLVFMVLLIMYSMGSHVWALPYVIQLIPLSYTLMFPADELHVFWKAHAGGPMHMRAFQFLFWTLAGAWGFLHPTPRLGRHRTLAANLTLTPVSQGRHGLEP